MNSLRRSFFLLVIALLFVFAVAAVAHAREKYRRHHLLLGLRAGLSTQGTEAFLRKQKLRKATAVAPGVLLVKLPLGVRDERSYGKALEKTSEVEFAELDTLLAPQISINDPLFSSEWHLATIQAPPAWDINAGAPSTVIAILDSGVDGTHPDLAARLVVGWNVYGNNSNTSDVNGHGTMVAGAAAAAMNNSVGIVGVCGNCGIMPIRVSDANGFASESAIASGLTYAANHGARVANLSFVLSNSSSVSAAADYFRSKGGVVTVSAGNAGTVLSNADDPNLINVSATSRSDTIAPWSNTGAGIDLSAPGESIYSTVKGGGYSLSSGTSLSSAIAAGTAALVISANPLLSSATIESTLKNSADDLGPAGWDPAYGAGRVNALKAVLAAGSGLDTIPPSVSFTSPAEGALISGMITLRAAAADNVGVASVEFFIDGQSLGKDGSSPYELSLNTVAHLNGAHTLTAKAADTSGNTAHASRPVTVSNAPTDGQTPSVAITSPRSGASLIRGTIPVGVNASDNVKVTRVELYVDGVLSASSAAAPFTLQWNAKKAARGSHSLFARAYDAANNKGQSAAITVTLK